MGGGSSGSADVLSGVSGSELSFIILSSKWQLATFVCSCGSPMAWDVCLTDAVLLLGSFPPLTRSSSSES